MNYLRFQLRQLMQRMWFLPAAFSVVAVLTVGIAFSLAGYLPEELPFVMPENAVQTVLQILASSLLTVAVFALSTVVSALAAASSSTTPRAVPLISGDLQAQTSISVFIGAFLFSIVGIIGLAAGIYSEAGRLFLFFVTLLVVVLVVAALIRWIGQISAIGRVGNTVDAVEKETRNALGGLKATPLFDCRALEGKAQGQPIHAASVAYVQYCDAADLQALAEEHDLRISIMSRPGAYATPLRPLMLVEGAVNDEIRTALIDCFSLGNSRTYDADPRYGLVVLGEIADRALSPGVNDPGTAIDVIDTVTRLLIDWEGEDRPRAIEEKQEAGNTRVFITPLSPHDMLEDAFRPIARDGASVVEVMIRMQKSLETLASCNRTFAMAARALAEDALWRAENALEAPSDLTAIRGAASWLGTSHPA